VFSGVGIGLTVCIMCSDIIGTDFALFAFICIYIKTKKNVFSVCLVQRVIS